MAKEAKSSRRTQGTKLAIDDYYLWTRAMAMAAQSVSDNGITDGAIYVQRRAAEIGDHLSRLTACTSLDPTGGEIILYLILVDVDGFQVTAQLLGPGGCQSPDWPT